MHHEQHGFSINSVPGIAKEIETFCLQAEQETPVLKTLWNGWQKGLDEILEKTSQETPCSRVAVIGSIKSGKSTFVNALVQSDILRRGAGTLTSAITRLIPSDVPRAVITWKGWNKVNAEAGYAATLLAGMTGAEETPVELDLRQEPHREIVTRLLDRIGPSPAALPRYALNQLARLRAFSSGFPRISAHMQEESTILVLEREWFLQHREIVSSDDAAAYVDDVQVEFPFPESLPKTQVADCQGSDSLNPSHIVSVQDYLLQTDWAIYMINSVMGLREADEKLLEVVKALGLADNILFVLNTDVDAHSGVDDLNRVKHSVETWIASHLGPPRLYTVHVLKELYQGLEKKDMLSEKEMRRLESWRQDADMMDTLQSRWQDLATFWRDEIAPSAGRFQRAFAQRSLINLTGRLGQSIRIASNPYGVDLATLKVCSVEAEKLLPNMDSHLQGTAMKGEKQVRDQADSLLDPGFSELGKAIKDFIQGYTSHWDPTKTVQAGSMLNVNGMTLSLAEEFNQAMHLFLVDRVNTEITRKVYEIVSRIQGDFSTVVDMYRVVLNNNYLKFQQSQKPVISSGKTDAGTDRARSQGGVLDEGRIESQGMDVRELVKNPHVELFSLKVELSLRQKAMALARQGWMLSFKRTRGWFAHRIFKTPIEDEDAVKAQVLLIWRDRVVKSLKKDGKALMKQEMTRYRETLKYQVLIKYVQDLARACREELKGRVNAFQEDVEHAKTAPGLSDREVMTAREHLPEWEARLKEIEALIRS